MWTELHGAQGGAEPEQWVGELLYLNHRINLPKNLLESLLHSFNIRDADSATISTMLDSEDDEDVNLDGSTFLYANTARNDNPSHWQRGIDVEV